jgi:hypothetical protein
MYGHVYMQLCPPQIVNACAVLPLSSTVTTTTNNTAMEIIMAPDLTVIDKEIVCLPLLCLKRRNTDDSRRVDICRDRMILLCRNTEVLVKDVGVRANAGTPVN